MKKLYIAQILKLKNEAIALGFDYPTQDPREATTAELRSFLTELQQFILSERN